MYRAYKLIGYTQDFVLSGAQKIVLFIYTINTYYISTRPQEKC